MFGDEIIRAVRAQVDDEEEEYLWKDYEFVDYLNRAYLDFVKGTRILADISTASICQVRLLANLGLYALDRTVTSVESGRLALNPTSPLTLRNRAAIDDLYPNWQNETGTPRYLIIPAETLSLFKVQFAPRYYTDFKGEVVGASNITFTAGTKIISMAGGAFSTHLAIGDSFNVSGTTLNNGYFTVADVTATEIEVNETLADEVLTSAVIRQVEDTATLTVTRLPVTEFTLTNLKTLEPEIPWDYHRDLYEGIKGYAYMKQDSDTYDPKLAMMNQQKFEANIEKAKRDLLRRKNVRHILTPHPGTI